MSNIDILVVIIIIMPVLFVMFIAVIEAAVLFMEDTLPKIQKLKRKNYCKKCGITIPRGETYCDSCRCKRWEL